MGNIDVRKTEQPETCIMINDTSQCSVAMITNLLLSMLKEFLKKLNIWQKLIVSSDLCAWFMAKMVL